MNAFCMVPRPPLHFDEIATFCLGYLRRWSFDSIYFRFAIFKNQVQRSCGVTHARHAIINKNFEIKQLQGLLMSTTNTAGKENHKKGNSVDDDTNFTEDTRQCPVTFLEHMRVPNVLAVGFPNAARNTESAQTSSRSCDSRG